jgi:hypothetical protein
MRSQIAGYGRITVHVVAGARVEIDGNIEECDLTSTFARRLLENAALLATANSGQKVENL